MEAFLSGKPKIVYWCNALVRHPWFQNFIISVIVGNTITLSMDYYNMPESVSDGLTIANVVFSVVFLGEMVLKLAGVDSKQ